MLKNVPRIISPELLMVLAEMGHGDELVIGDGNFPAAHTAAATRTNILIDCSGLNVPLLLDAILQMIPLDIKADKYAYLMDCTPDASIAEEQRRRPLEEQKCAWEAYGEVFSRYGYTLDRAGLLRKPGFLKQAEHAYAVLSASEPERCGCIILKKGVL